MLRVFLTCQANGSGRATINTRHPNETVYSERLQHIFRTGRSYLHLFPFQINDPDEKVEIRLSIFPVSLTVSAKAAKIF